MTRSTNAHSKSSSLSFQSTIIEKSIIKALSVLLLLLSLFWVSVANAEPLPQNLEKVESSSDQDYSALLSRFEERLNIKILSIADAPVPGLLQINATTGLFYGSEDGEYFLTARIYKVGNQIVDETGEALKRYRLDGLKTFTQSVIEYKAEKEKYAVTVFTDATCGFCRKLHNEMDILNSLGITVRYLAFPRAGINSRVYNDTVSIWCSADPNKAMDDAKAGQRVARAACENEVAEQYNFGQAIGVNGTPNIVLPDGSIVNGYQPAQTLLKTIEDAVKA
ncbi:thioredoxin fold domain-containing protein [Glaciecola sp. MH2013]|uniref:thioredoxin fold domain-containing protein n=1 Tax=Glaciecola sp. MH2013 TaxID=2785524 RepID=UPI00189F4D0B|nr:thioredoxin fold domain-containing protein [Glaciecola sp. MH2013]MBF7075075.1 thioredoxin fold domain-containing protein [Glaciecola sp. MH2013]